jgi:hypothetical protein
LRELIGRAQQQCGARVAELRRVHAGLLDLARLLEPPVPADVEVGTRPSVVVQRRVQTHLEQLNADVACGRVSDWLREPVLYVGVVLRRLGEGLYHCYDVPSLPRTDNALEQFYRRVKTEQRRITGRKRADAFVVRVGGFAVYATASSSTAEDVVRKQLALVPAVDWQQQRVLLRQTQARQAKMHRFRLRRAAYLSDLEARWTELANPP